MNILIVTTAFYPEQAIGSIRISKFAKYFDAAGDQLTIISLQPTPWALRDETLYFKGLENHNWNQVGQSKLFGQVFGKARRLVVGDRSGLSGISLSSINAKGIGRARAKIKKSVQFLYTLAKAVDWNIQVKKFAKANLSGQKFDIILTSYPSLASPMAGVSLKRMGYADRLLLDFRDPISYGKVSRFSLPGVLSRYFLNNADLTSFTSMGVANKVLINDATAGHISQVFPNGFDSDDSLALEKIPDFTRFNKLSFCYVGSLYGGKRDLKLIFSALSEMIVAGVISRDRLVFEYAGGDGNIFLSYAAKFDMAELVVDHGIVSRTESLCLLRKSDICLLGTWNTPEDQGVLPGKMFEFFLLRKPILAVINGTLVGSEAKNLIDQVAAGFCIEEASDDLAQDIELMKKWIIHCFNQKLSVGRLDNSYNSEVEQFDMRAIVTRLRDWMQIRDIKR